MDHTDAFAWTAAGLATAVALIPGVVAVGTGRLLPWLGGQVPRPRMWGWGNILIGLFLATEFVLRYVVFTGGGATPGFLVGLPFGVAGFALIVLSRRSAAPAPRRAAADGVE